MNTPEDEIMMALMLEIARSYEDGFKGSVDGLFEEICGFADLENYRTNFQKALEYAADRRIAKLFEHEGVRTYVTVKEPLAIELLFRKRDEGLSFVEEAEWQYPVVGSYLELGEEWLSEYIEARLSEQALSGVGAIPASDRKVDLSDNQEAVELVDEKIAAASEVIIKSNTLDPEEKELWARLLEEGRAWLKRPTTYIAAISALLVKPLYDAYSSVLEDSAKPIVEAALVAVKALFGL